MRRREFLAAAAAALAAASPSSVLADPQRSGEVKDSRYDILLKNGRVLDGAGTPWYLADIAIRNGRIAGIGRVDSRLADRVVDVDGLFVAPGFIDIHSHSDFALFDDPWMESKIRQGITTEVNGNCGTSPVPGGRRSIAQSSDLSWITYFDQLQDQGVGLNVATLVGHGSVRRHVMSDDPDIPNRTQLEAMKELVRDAMQAGALGLSTGLAYFPGVFAHTDEVVELAKIVADHQGLYATHLRDFSSKVLGWSGEDGSVYKAVEEAIKIGRRSGVRAVQISHLSANSPYSGDPTLDEQVHELILAARQEGIDVLLDVLPSDWGAVSPWPARSIFPPAYFDEGKEALLERLQDPVERAQLRRDVLTKPPAEMGFENTTARLLLLRSGKPDGIWIFPPVNGRFKNRAYERQTLDVIARMKGVDPVDALFDLLIEEEGEIHIANKLMEDRNSQLLWSNAMPSTDGGSALKPGQGNKRVRPSGFSGFSDALIWVRDTQRVSLEEMIRKMSALPAHVLDLSDRGMLREGLQADITVFDLDSIESRSTYENDAMPGYPTGFPFVLVNGTPVIDNGRRTDALPGQILKHESSS
jgi:N-acyl-D-amino-acid deacylase